MGEGSLIEKSPLRLLKLSLDMGCLRRKKHALVRVNFVQSVGIWGLFCRQASIASIIEILTLFLGWTAAFVTGVYNFDALRPTVIEWLTFWVASAMRLQGWRTIPKVCDEPPYLPNEIPCTVYDVLSGGGSDSAALALLGM